MSSLPAFLSKGSAEPREGWRWCAECALYCAPDDFAARAEDEHVCLRHRTTTDFGRESGASAWAYCKICKRNRGLREFSTRMLSETKTRVCKRHPHALNGDSDGESLCSEEASEDEDSTDGELASEFSGTAPDKRRRRVVGSSSEDESSIEEASASGDSESSAEEDDSSDESSSDEEDSDWTED